MFAVFNINNSSECSDGSLHSTNGMRALFFARHCERKKFTVSVYPRAERQCARSILMIVLNSGTGIDTFLLIPVLLCSTNHQTSSHPLSSAVRWRPLAATWPPLQVINRLLITLQPPKLIHVLRSLVVPVAAVVGSSPTSIRLEVAAFSPAPTWRVLYFGISALQLRAVPSTAPTPTPGSPITASGCMPSTSASWPGPAATACFTPACSTSTGSSTPWVPPASRVSAWWHWPSASVTSRAYVTTRSRNAPGAHRVTLTAIREPSCPCGWRLRRINGNFVFICIIWLTHRHPRSGCRPTQPRLGCGGWRCVLQLLSNR